MKIEEYIHKNKKELDSQLPDREKLWNSIENSLLQKRVKRLQIIRWVAASVMVLLVVGSLIRHELIINDQLTSLSKINKELGKKELDYKNKIATKWTQFASIKAGESPIEPMLIDELKNLDTLYLKGLEEIENTGYNERAVVILLKTYEKRLRIIEQLIYEKQKQRNYENKNIQVEI
ncbi:MAG: hypothetical protein JEZ09_13710 [Salinivirgaceae bacterium]|nr:hypothetical protein [Salinivirgaceae bacterium]